MRRAPLTSVARTHVAAIVARAARSHRPIGSRLALAQRVRFNDLAFVALVAFGSGWTVAGIGLELMAAADSRSILWLALSRLFLGLAGLTFVIAFGRSVWRARQALLCSVWRGPVALTAITLALLALSFGSVGPAWWIGVAAVAASFVLLPETLRGTA
jgi:hypothetical protein